MVKAKPWEHTQMGQTHTAPTIIKHRKEAKRCVKCSQNLIKTFCAFYVSLLTNEKEIVDKQPIFQAPPLPPTTASTVVIRIDPGPHYDPSQGQT